MSKRADSDMHALRCAAIEATRGWSFTKKSVALRAAGLDYREGERESLDAIAADLGVSRETVRRARIELLHAIGPLYGTTSDSVYSSLALHSPSEPSADSPATARALRRLLTMTGPLPWDEVVSAWARAGGKPPYFPLPADVGSMRRWVREAGGFTVSPEDATARSATITADAPEDLDQVSQFLFDMLSGQPGGVDRSELLEQAEGAGLKRTTIATTLSFHPAVSRVGRGRWVLRGRRQNMAKDSAGVVGSHRTGRTRPTTFTWGADGALIIEFSVSGSPSPVVAVPKAVSELVEGREFRLDEGEKATRVSVRSARLWGFGALVSKMKMQNGARVAIALNLLTRTATITPVEGQGTR